MRGVVTQTARGIKGDLMFCTPWNFPLITPHCNLDLTSMSDQFQNFKISTSELASSWPLVLLATLIVKTVHKLLFQFHQHNVYKAKIGQWWKYW